MRARVGRLGGMASAVVLACLVAAEARAADLSPAPPVLTTASPWSGLYAGSFIGYGHASFKTSGAAGSSSAGAWGLSTGALLGYSFQSGPFVFGPEGEISYNSRRAHFPGVPGLVAPSGVESLDTERLRARFGYALGDFLPFVAAGVAFNRLYQFNDPLEQFGVSRQETGFTLGAGVEWRFVAPIFGPVTLRGEYVYDSYPTETMAFPGGQFRAKASEQIFRLGLISYPGASHGEAVAVAPTSFWAGDYAGVIGGGLFARPQTSFGGVSTSYAANGAEYGLLGGHNFVFGPWVVGYEGATLLSNAHGTGPQPGAANVSFDNFFETDLRARAGYAFGRFLPYVTAGATWGRSQQVDLATGSQRGNISSEAIAAGGGVEYQIDENWATRLEYLHDTPFSHVSTGLNGLALAQKRSANELRLGLEYYFH